jgi:hypothetical protein
MTITPMEDFFTVASRNNKSNEDDYADFRIIVVEGRGSGSHLRGIAEAVANAFARPQTSQRSLPYQQSQLVENRGNGTTTAYLPPAEDEDDEKGAPTTVSKPTVRRTTGARRVYPKPSILPIDLNAGDVPFREFFNSKNPSGHVKRYLVIAYWLKEYREINEVHDDHIYTCYRALGMNVVKDIGSHFRAGKQQGWFDSGTTQGTFTINHIGEGVVNDLGKA